MVMKVRSSRAGLRGGLAVSVLIAVALQSCTAETEGPQPEQQPSTTARAPLTITTRGQGAAITTTSATAPPLSTITTASSALISSPGGTDDELDQAPAVGPEPSLAAPPPSSAGPDGDQTAEGSSAMDRPPVSYLTATIPPCTPIEGTEEETCRSGFPLISIGQSPGGYNIEVISVSPNSSGEIDVNKSVIEVHGDYFYERAELNPTISQIVMGESRVVAYPHLVIRATTRPHTTRCEKYPRRIGVWLDYICFVDVRVNEYIIGKGPPNLTIAVYEESVGIQPRGSWELLSNEWLDVKFNNPALRVAKAYEGREMIILLTIPYTSSVETLQMAGVYFVIKPEDGPVLVSPLHVDGLNTHTVFHADVLVDLVQQYRDAAESRHESSYGSSSEEIYLPPVLVEDANYLQDIYQKWAAEDKARGYEVMDYHLALPPPPPSAEVQP